MFARHASRLQARDLAGHGARCRCRTQEASPAPAARNTRTSTKAGVRRGLQQRRASRQLRDRRGVAPPVVVTVGPKHPLTFGGVYEQPRAARWIHGPAFARREVSWPTSAETWDSPAARPAARSAGQSPQPMSPESCYLRMRVRATRCRGSHPEYRKFREQVSAHRGAETRLARQARLCGPQRLQFPG